MKKLFILLFVLSFSFIKAQDAVKVSYDKNGQPLSGTYLEYYESGSVKAKVNYKEGIKNGPLVIFTEDGHMKELYSYKDGVFHGVFKSWDNNNLISGIAYYREGQKDGLWKIYDQGSLIYKIEYANGKRIKAEKLD